MTAKQHGPPLGKQALAQAAAVLTSQATLLGTPLTRMEMFFELYDLLCERERERNWAAHE